MQITDPIADMLTRIRNAGNARQPAWNVPASKMKEAIAQILLDEGYIKSFEVVEGNTQGIIRIALKYVDNRQKLSPASSVYRSRACVYTPAHRSSRKVLRGLGIAIGFYVERRHDRQEGSRAERRRRSSRIRLVREV